MARIGILGGTFNPPHRGHLQLARQALGELSLERVVLMPVSTPPHKPGGEDPGPAHRLEMCRLAVASEPRIGACALELERGGPSYTADTLREIHERDPEAELTFIVGADTARTLPSWREPQVVLELAELAVAARAGTDRDEVNSALEAAAAGSPVRPRVSFLEMAPVDASSSAARELLAAGRDASGMLGEQVASYVAEHGLYGTTPRGEG